MHAPPLHHALLGALTALERNHGPAILLTCAGKGPGTVTRHASACRVDPRRVTSTRTCAATARAQGVGGRREFRRTTRDCISASASTARFPASATRAPTVDVSTLFSSRIRDIVSDTCIPAARDGKRESV